jgi:hypothetical protein
MNKHYSILKNEWQLILSLAIYLIIGILLINHYQYILNSDGISYISIAKNYLNGNFADAVNGYWGPLFSWLLTPFLFFGSAPLYILYSTKVLSLIIGFFTMIGIRLLIHQFEMERTAETIILFSLIPAVLFFSFNVITPDLLVTCILIYYLYYIFSPEYSSKLLNGFLCGLLGSLAYLSKSYALTFFLAHFILFNLIYYFKAITKTEKRKILKNLFLGLTVFFIISGAWIGLISAKYGEVTIGTTGSYNYALVGPQSQGQHPMGYQGLLKPPNNNAISVWEDPSYIKINSWNPLTSWDYFKYQMNIIWNNIFNIMNIIESFSVISILVIIGSIWFIIKSRDTSASRSKIIYLLITIVLYSAGYSLVLVIPRYLWLIFILIILMGGYLINLLFKNNLINNSMKKILLILLVFSFIITPINGLINGYNAEENIYQLGNILKNNYNLDGNIASNAEWEITTYSVYYAGGKYYGQTKENTTFNELKKELSDNNINYYLVWGNSKENVYLSRCFKEITNNKIEGLKIYKIN